MTLPNRVHGRGVPSRRARVLARHLAPWLPGDARVLDVGCGDGQLAQAMASLRPDASITGMDSWPCPSATGPVRPIDVGSLPHEDDAFDVVLLVDVLHHAEDPKGLLAEAARVARQRVLIKDHLLECTGAGLTLRATHWMDRSRHGADRPVRLWNRRRWWAVFEEVGLRNEVWRETLGLYPRPAHWWLDRSLHFAAWLEPEGAPVRPDHVPVAAADADAWEAAYRRFETPEEEVEKFERRLRFLGVSSWPHEVEIVELFCGRGGGVRALERLGFTRVEGIDASAALVAKYSGRSRLHVGDCRHLPFGDESKDVAIVHGGLHHLERLPGDLRRTLAEARRVLRPAGRVVIVEPWQTPFLGLVHTASRVAVLARLWPRLDAFAEMTRYELPTYEAWLSHPEMVRSVMDEYFDSLQCSIRWGKLLLVGRRRSDGVP